MNNDRMLIDRLILKEYAAQREIMEAYRSRLFLFFRLRIKGEQYYEDLVQEVLASFFDAITKNKIQEDKFIAPFIFGVAKNVMYNYFYKKKRDANILKRGEERFEGTYDFEEEERLSDEALNQAIKITIDKYLNETDKLILKEFYLGENDLETVASTLGKTRHYISVRKERALKRLKIEILKQKHLFMSGQ